MVSRLVLVVIGMMLVQLMVGQSVKYTPDFKFKDGVFLDFEQVKQNKPIGKARLVSNMDTKDKKFFDALMQQRKLIYFDDLGNSQEVSTESVWGYSKNGILYIRLGDGFNRITIIGSICHFVATITTVSQRYPSYYPYGYGYYRYGYGYYPTTYRTSEVRQFVLDFETGEIKDYEPESIEVLLMKDPELYDDFNRLSDRKKRQMLFMYLRKYNEAHPLYIGE